MAVFAAYVTYWMATYRPAGFPPGPTPVPLLGTVSRTATRQEYIDKSAKKYGPIHSMSFQGVRAAVIVEDYEVYKADIKGNAPVYANRPYSGLFAYLGFDKGILSSNGAHWLATRKYALAALRGEGVGSKGFIPSIVREADHLIAKMAKVAGRPAQLRVIVQASIANMVSSLIFGERYADGDKELDTIINVLESQDTNTDSLMLRCMMEYGSMMSVLPAALLDKIPAVGEFKRSVKLSMLTILLLTSMIGQKLEKRAAAFDCEHPKGLVDMWLIERDRQENSQDNKYLQRMDVLVGSIMDLFFAGIETTSMTINWAMKYLAAYPELQEKLYQEIRDKVGSKDEPDSAIIGQLHLLQAFVHEVLRHSSIAPQGVEHCTTDPAKIGPYRVPAGTTVVLDLYNIHRDPRYWKSPAAFDATNFLDDSGKFKCPQQFMAFGFGNRICIGQQLAKAELYAYLIRIMQNFSISASGDKGVDLSPWGDFLRRPTDSALILTCRA
eukprot:scaffold361568_cov41-Prasinocladus_malaysianus.AAC.1